ncbi:hypothetical protein CgunFtcFv8_016171 [Champsocephalus gunnari]|uniref:Uncharacterized protein n=1 Tax=Champsocephalus gunnari TaxID=52237 RepID=A0AAN8CQP8_CHAGU|nr:hypothetical protein CgunFtcFv8_016171 [Champsocephalus gunnari]
MNVTIFWSLDSRCLYLAAVIGQRETERCSCLGYSRKQKLMACLSSSFYHKTERPETKPEKSFSRHRD